MEGVHLRGFLLCCPNTNRTIRPLVPEAYELSASSSLESWKVHLQDAERNGVPINRSSLYLTYNTAAKLGIEFGWLSDFSELIVWRARPKSSPHQRFVSESFLLITICGSFYHLMLETDEGTLKTAENWGKHQPAQMERHTSCCTVYREYHFM